MSKYEGEPITQDMFRCLVQDALEFVFSHRIASILNVHENKVYEWADGVNLPTGPSLGMYYAKLQCHEFWDEFF